MREYDGIYIRAFEHFAPDQWTPGLVVDRVGPRVPAGPRTTATEAGRYGRILPRTRERRCGTEYLAAKRQAARVKGHIMNRPWTLLTFRLFQAFLVVAVTVSEGATRTDLQDALVMAAFGGRIAEVEELLKKGADINAPDSGGEPEIFTVAASPMRVAMVKFLLEHSAKVNAIFGCGSQPLRERRGLPEPLHQELLRY